ncbi:MAG: serine hydrolase [Lewinellaceae bacterium]|nr:serine hydrolase [Lewinellaceae bacterium]
MRLRIILLLGLFLPLLSFGQSTDGDYLAVKTSTFIPLNQWKSNDFQSRLANALNANPAYRALIASKRLAVGIVDMHDPTHIAYATVNGDNMMYAASLPKIAILLAAEDALFKGELTETAEIDADLRMMIARSDNQAATRMIDRLGYDKIQNVLEDPKYRLYSEEQGGGLWVGKRYGSGGDRHPDPLKGLSHAATVNQVCRFYYMMYYGKLVSPSRSAEMMRIMKDPELHHKFVNTVDRVAPGATMFRKSGSWKNYHADSILVDDGGNRRYILVALAEDAQGEQIMRDLVRIAEQVMHIPASSSNTAP